MGKPHDALAVFREVYAIDEGLLKTSPPEHLGIARRNFIGSNIKLADMHRFLDEYPEAIEYYRKALAMAREMVDSGNTSARRLRNVARMGLGKTLRLAGDAEAAAPELKAVLEDMRAIVAEDPGNVRPLQDYLVAVQDLGDAEAALGRDEAALALYREQLDVAQRLAEGTPGNIEHTLSEAFAHERAADTLLKLDRDDEALREYALALGRAQEVREKDAGVGVAHEIIVVVNRKLGEWWLERSTGAGSEEARRAESHFRAALEAVTELESRSITPQHSGVNRMAISGLLELAAQADSPPQ
jgi:tetratricopeptide (TPR) repeat protein